MKNKADKILLHVPFITSLFLAFVTCNLVYSQSPAYVDLARLKTDYPEERVIISQAKSTYTFDLQSIENRFVVIEEHEDQFVSLKPNSRVVHSIFYDRHSEILKHSVRGNGLHNPAFDRKCHNYEQRGIFYSDAKQCVFSLAFNNEAEHLVLKTTKKTFDPKYFSSVHIIKPVSVDRGVIKIIIPNAVEVELLELNFDNFDISKTIENTPNQKTITYEYKGLPSLNFYDNLPDEAACLLPMVYVQIKSYRRANVTTKVFDDKKDLFDWYITNIPKVEISPELSDFTIELTQNINTDQEKIEAVYAWINDKIRYIAFTNGTAGYVPEDPNVVFRKKYGDCKGMAILAKTMLKQLGFDARLAWVYSGNICFPDELVSLAIHNHMICAVKLNDKFLFIDPTAESNPFSEIPESIQGRKTVIENGEGWVVEDIPAIDVSDNYIGTNNTIFIEGKNVKINGNILLKGVPRQYYSAIFRSIPQQEQHKIAEYFVTKSKAGYKPDSISTSIINNLVSELDISYSLKINNVAVYAGNKLFVNPDFSKDFQQSVIDTTRKYPFSHLSRMFKEYLAQINIPAGYTVLEIPAGIRIDEPGFMFETRYELIQNQLVYYKKIHIKNNILYPEDFERWNSAIEHLRSEYRKMITFEKM